MKERHVARMIVLDPANRILLLNISPKGSMDPNNPITKPFWITPGGEIEAGETAQQAVLRELQEETGITNATVYEPAAWYGEVVLEKKGITTLFKQWFFLVRVAAQALSMADIGDDEKAFTQGFKWWTLQELQDSADLFIPTCLHTDVEPLLHTPPTKTKTIDVSVKKQ